MKVLVILFGLFGASFAADYETDVFDTIETWWNLMPKANGENVTFFDLVDFFKYYDTEYDNVTDEGLFEVTEDEFAVAWGRQLNVDDDAARAYFKRMDISQYQFDFLPERVTELDCLLFIDELDSDSNGQLDEEEFIGQFSFLFSDLPWGVMFIRYRTRGTDPVFGYDDSLTFDTANNGDWQKLFDAIDADDDGYFTMNEVSSFFAAGDYGSAEFASEFFAICDLTNSGLVEKIFEWSFLFSRLTSAEYLSYSEFMGIDYLVRPISGPEQ